MNGEPYLRALEGASPSGVELRHESGFLALERLLEPATRRNRIDSNGELSLTAAVDWGKVLSDAEELAKVGRDIRLLAIVVRAWANTEGFRGLAAGFDLIADSLVAHWDSIHPELRDRSDKAMAAKGRENAIKDLMNRDDGVLGDLEMNVVLNPMGIGPIRGSELAQASLSEYEHMQTASGGMSSSEKAAYAAEHAKLSTRVKAAISATKEDSPDELAALRDAIETADQSRTALEAAYAKAAGLENGGGLYLSDLGTFLGKCLKAIEGALENRTETAPSAGEAPMAPSGQGVAAPVASGGVPGRIESRRDVEKCLDSIIDFYERTEPSSPIPHLAQRMRRMVSMDFMELMAEIAPSGLKEFKSAAGVDDKKRND